MDGLFGSWPIFRGDVLVAKQGPGGRKLSTWNSSSSLQLVGWMKHQTSNSSFPPVVPLKANVNSLRLNFSMKQTYTWMFPENSGTPKSSILIGFSIINHLFWGKIPYFWKHPHHITSPGWERSQFCYRVAAEAGGGNMFIPLFFIWILETSKWVEVCFYTLYTRTFQFGCQMVPLQDVNSPSFRESHWHPKPQGFPPQADKLPFWQPPDSGRPYRSTRSHHRHTIPNWGFGKLHLPPE